MAKTCPVLNKTSRVGRKKSHSNKRSPRTFEVNLQEKTYFVPSLGRKVTLRLSTKAIKTISRDGIDKHVQRLIREGYKF